MNTECPKLPPVKILCNGKYTYVYTYLGTWQPAIKDKNGNVVKKASVKVSNRKTIGKIVCGGKSGPIKLNDAFLAQNPQFKNVAIFRNQDGSMNYAYIDESSVNSRDEGADARHIASGGQDFGSTFKKRLISNSDDSHADEM